MESMQETSEGLVTPKAQRVTDAVQYMVSLPLGAIWEMYALVVL